jgi:hypothetical protein
MTEQDFYRGWTMLLAQPYAKDYAFDQAKEGVQLSIFKKRYLDEDSHCWIAACESWISREDHFPLIPEMDRTVKNFRPQPRPLPRPLPPQLLTTSSVRGEERKNTGFDPPEDYPPRLIARHMMENNCSWREATITVMTKVIRHVAEDTYEAKQARSLLAEAQRWRPVSGNLEPVAAIGKAVRRKSSLRIESDAAPDLPEETI